MASAAGSDTGIAFRSRWGRQSCWLALGLLAAVGIHFATYANLAATWWGSTAYNHCLLIPFIATWLVWQDRTRLRAIEPDVSMAALVFIALNSLLWLAGEMMLINLLRHIAAIGFVIGMIWALIGDRLAMTLLFPLAYLYFMVPEGIFLVPYLQDWTATVLVGLLRLTDIPVYLEGRYLQIPSGNFHVAKACSGINYLLATLAIGSMFAYLNYVSNWRRFAFMLLAIAVPLIANGMRAYGIVMIAHLSDYRYAMGVDHYIYGWVFFGIVIFTLFMIGRTFSDIDTAPARVPKPPAVRPARAQPAVALTLAAAVLLLALPHWGLARSAQVVRGADGFGLPVVTGWSGPHATEIELGGRFRGAQRTLSAEYTDSDGARVLLTFATYLEPREGAELVHYENAPFDHRTWQLVSGEGSAVTGVESVRDVHERRIRRGEQERLLWWWYQIGPTATRYAAIAKLAEAWHILSGDYDGAAFVVLSTAVPPTGDAATTLAAFLEALGSAGLATQQAHNGAD